MPATDRSANVDYLAHVTGKLSYKPGEPFNVGGTCPAYNPSKCPGFSALNFLHYENLGYDFMVANGTAGLSVWSLRDPGHPKFVSQVPVSALGARDPDDDATSPMTQFWEGENMTVDSRRKIAFMSRDALTRGFFAIDLKDPWHPSIIGFQQVFQGHTMTCLNDCRFLWSVGGVQRGPTPAKASAVSVTDVRDVEHPFTYSTPIASDVNRLGSRGSTHSVDVDFDGVAWVSGSGGVRGYWTEGLHKDPKTGTDRFATPYDPIPYAGGSVAGDVGSFLHNAYHVPGALGDQAAGDVMLITNENNKTDCAVAGKFLIASLKGTRDATDNVGTPQAPVTMERLASYSTQGKPGEFIDPVTPPPGQPRGIGDCSAHWFTVKGNIVALGNYEQGTRFVDVSDPRNPQQVGYFRVPAQGTRGTPGEVVSSNTAGAYWHGGYVYISDYARGIDVIKYNGAIPGKLQPHPCWNSCADSTVWTNDQPGGVGGSVGATLALTLGGNASFGAFTPGVAKDYTASTTANVISTAGDAALTSSTPGNLMNGTFALPSPLEVSFSKSTWSAPVSNDQVTINFKQHISAGDALRTGAYSKTLTFTLSTTTP
jgi:hypothetical protein